MGRKRRKRRGGSMSSYFRTVFQEKPEWLRQKSNDEVIARYRADHKMAADADVGKSVKQTMANVKSILRKGIRQGPNGRGARAAARVPTEAMANYVRTGKATLENLEELAHRHQGPGVRPVTARHVIKRAVRLDVAEFRPRRARQRL